MSTTIDPRYTFRFVEPGAQNRGRQAGRRTATHSRQIYWEDLYAFRSGRRSYLVAVRTVPAASDLFALYMVLRRSMRWGPRPAAEEQTARPRRKPGIVLANGVRSLMRLDQASLPVHLNKRADELVSTAVVRALTIHHLEPMVDNSFFEPVIGQEDHTEAAPASRQYPFLSGAGGEDVAWVRAANELFEELHGVAAELKLRLPEAGALSRTQALTRPASASEALWALYGNPRCLTVVAKTMRARGGFMSPLVQHFLGLLWRMLREEGYRQPELGNGDDLFWEERLRSILGRAEANQAGRIPSCEVTVVGELMAGELRPSGGDPERTRHGFHVDPAVAVANLLLAEIRGRTRRLRVSALVRRGLRRPVRAIRFAGS